MTLPSLHTGLLVDSQKPSSGMQMLFLQMTPCPTGCRLLPSSLLTQPHLSPRLAQSSHVAFSQSYHSLRGVSWIPGVSSWNSVRHFLQEAIRGCQIHTVEKREQAGGCGAAQIYLSAYRAQHDLSILATKNTGNKSKSWPAGLYQWKIFHTAKGTIECRDASRMRKNIYSIWLRNRLVSRAAIFNLWVMTVLGVKWHIHRVAKDHWKTQLPYNSS